MAVAFIVADELHIAQIVGGGARPLDTGGALVALTVGVVRKFGDIIALAYPRRFVGVIHTQAHPRALRSPNNGGR